MKASKRDTDSQLMYEGYIQKLNEQETDMYGNVYGTLPEIDTDVASADDAIAKNREEILDNLYAHVETIMDEGEWSWGSVEDFASDYKELHGTREILSSTLDGTFDEEDMDKLVKGGNVSGKDELEAALVNDMLKNPEHYADVLEVSGRIPHSMDEDPNDIDNK